MGNVKEMPGWMSTLLQWRQEENGQEVRKKSATGRPDQTRVSGIEGDARLNQGLSNHRTLCPRIMDPGIKKQILGLQGESVMGGA